MNIFIGKHSGFCPGVQNAVEKALNSGENSCTLGEIIHNERVINKLKEKGIFPINDPNEVNTKKVVIRSHGVPPLYYEILKQKGVEVVDATCKYVLHTQNLVNKKSREGYKIVIIGAKDHPEVIGIAGNVEGQPIYIEKVDEIIDLKCYEKVCVVAQTTFRREEFNKIIPKIQSMCIKLLEVFDTICYTTTVRQKETRELAQKCQLMVVVGSKISANTTELYNISKKYCDNVIFCQSCLDIKNINFKQFENIGIVAGASAPSELIEEVKLTMEETTMNVQPEVEIAEVADTKAVATDNEIITMDDVMSSLEKKKNFRRGQIIECTIESIVDDGLHLSIPLAKTEVLLPKEEISLDEVYDKTAFKVGDKIKVKVLSNDGKLAISRKSIEEESKIDESIGSIIDGEIFSMTFNQVNKGGLRGRLGSYNVFVPGSQIKIGYVNEKDFEKYKGKKLNLKVIKAEGKDLVASARVILEAEKNQKEDSFWSKIVVGETVTGKVMRFTEFGAFVSVEGFDCLAHISDLSWTNVKSCDEVLTIGESYEFKILKADRATNKVSLGYKQLQKRPIDIVAEKFPVDSIQSGTITRIKSFGAFVELEPNVEGLVHISQVAHNYIDNIGKVLNVGEQVDVKVMSIDLDKNKINLSMKALLPVPERAPVEKTEKDAKRPRRNFEREKREDELTSWVTGDGGASIADLIKKMEENN